MQYRCIEYSLFWSTCKKKQKTNKKTPSLALPDASGKAEFGHRPQIRKPDFECPPPAEMSSLSWSQPLSSMKYGT